jgi:DNA-binding NarL/FixJ family response regulator
MSNSLIKVAIVEDVPGTRESLGALIRRTSGMSCVAACASGEQAVRELPALAPDVVLMDIQLPGISGIQCAAQLKRLLPTVQILMLTTYEDSDLIFDSLRAGASGYLLKKMTVAEITRAIQQVHEGGSPMSVQIARKVVNHFQQLRKPDSEVEQLTPREQEILKLLAHGHYYKEIADQLGITTGTVGVHLHNIYEKLHVSSRTEAVVKWLGKK